MDNLTFIAQTMHALAWPASVVAFILLFRKQIAKMLPNITSVGGAGFKAEFDKKADELVATDIAPIQDELDGFREELKAGLAAMNITTKSTALEPEEPESKPDEQAVRKRIYHGLQSSPYEWRSIDRLASLSGSTEQQVLDILQPDAKVTLSKSKSGKRIAKVG